MLRDRLKRIMIQKELKNEKNTTAEASDHPTLASLKKQENNQSGISNNLILKQENSSGNDHAKSTTTTTSSNPLSSSSALKNSSSTQQLVKKSAKNSLNKPLSQKGNTKPSSSSNQSNNKEDKKRKLDQALSQSEKPSKKKKKNKKKKQKQDKKEGAVLKVETENIFISEQELKACFPNCSAVLRIGPRLILVAFEKEEQAKEYLTQEIAQESNPTNKKKLVVKKEMNGQQFTISMHGTKDIYRPSWFDVKPRTTLGVSLGLAENQKVTSKFASFLEKLLHEKLGTSENVSISDIHKGKVVFFQDATVEEKFKQLVESGEFKVPLEYIREKKKKERKHKKK
ncbi:hypothetical protein C9374_007523 [Naegleria lovaniensis]|uniref:Uncharacterized protein n=1 Tax=Naegleria lovaniensis TaxID=51637 RepID=A0AA88GKW1_NAELO|nr:uncharacterized protein C9374_007523 [Naegleria lovaniensis]KAG2379384.1 hypothetical protein C9374_007523 [Naegleria lovaniensis]